MLTYTCQIICMYLQLNLRYILFSILLHTWCLRLHFFHLPISQTITSMKSIFTGIPRVWKRLKHVKQEISRLLAHIIYSHQPNRNALLKAHVRINTGLVGPLYSSHAHALLLSSRGWENCLRALLLHCPAGWLPDARVHASQGAMNWPIVAHELVKGTIFSFSIHLFILYSSFKYFMTCKNR